MKKFLCQVGSWGGLIYSDEFRIEAKDRDEAEEICFQKIKEKLGEEYFGLFKYDLYQGNGGIYCKEITGGK